MGEPKGDQLPSHEPPGQSETRLTIARSLMFLRDAYPVGLPTHLAYAIGPTFQRRGSETTAEDVRDDLFSDETIRTFQPNDLPTREMLLSDLRRNVTTPRAPWTHDEGMSMIADESRWPVLLRSLVTKAEDTHRLIMESSKTGHPPSRTTASRLEVQAELILPLAQLLDPALHR